MRLRRRARAVATTSRATTDSSAATPVATAASPATTVPTTSLATAPGAATFSAATAHPTVAASSANNPVAAVAAVPTSHSTDPATVAETTRGSSTVPWCDHTAAPDFHALPGSRAPAAAIRSDRRGRDGRGVGGSAGVSSGVHGRPVGRSHRGRGHRHTRQRHGDDPYLRRLRVRDLGYRGDRG